MVDFSAVREHKQTYAELASSVTKADLYAESDTLVEQMLALLDGANDADITFVPDDPLANDAGASEEERHMAWTFGHLVVHATAGSEEAAMLALALARGVEPKERLRYETSWQQVTTVVQVRQRLEESRRMCKSMLDAWPDEPHLDITQTPIPRLGPMNAIARFLLGLGHEDSHQAQLREAMRQAQAARNA